MAPATHTDHDRIQVPSRRKDGTLDQTDPVEFIGDEKATKAYARHQAGTQAASAVDTEIRRARATEAAGDTDAPQDPFIADLTEQQKTAYDAAGKAAEAEVGKATTDESKGKSK